MSTLSDLRKDLKRLANPAKAKLLQRFFKTGKGEYGEGDIFLGIVVPKQRKIAEKYSDLDLQDLHVLIQSEIHEKRLICLFILVSKYKKSSENEKENIYEFYLKNARQINNWDLVDLSAPNIPGAHLVSRNRGKLYELAKSENLWEKRIAVLSCFAFIKNNDLSDALKIAEILLTDKQDLIHKAVGWMLREIGKRDKKAEEVFLKKHYNLMPRTMLRYAIEKFPEAERKRYLNGRV